MTRYQNVFATVLTQAAPSSNYRGESEENRTVLQKITRGNLEYTVVSPEALRNALRENLARTGLPMNRRRLHDEDQLAVEFTSFPDATKYADDYLFGYLVSKDADRMPEGRPSKRDSVLRMNMAVALSPYRYNALLHQSPLHAGDSPFKNADTSALIHREVVHTAYQFPFAIAGHDVYGNNVSQAPGWVRAFLASIGELADAAGGHARSYFEMSPRSIVARLTTSLVGGYDTYGFDESGDFPELARLKDDDLPPSEFWIGGDLARRTSEARRKELGARFFESPQKLLEELGKEAFKDA